MKKTLLFRSTPKRPFILSVITTSLIIGFNFYPHSETVAGKDENRGGTQVVSPEATATHADNRSTTDSESSSVPQHRWLDAVTMQYARATEQKEAFDFLWTPGLLIQQSLEDGSFIVYPPE
jgi:hypothetical protein